MAVTISQLLAEKWEVKLELLERDNRSTPPKESMDVDDDADVATLECLPNQFLDTSDCKRTSCDACLFVS